MFKDGYMSLSYKKLWELLIDKRLNKVELYKITGISKSTLNKLNNGKNINTEILNRICRALEYDVNDIVEYIKEGK